MSAKERQKARLTKDSVTLLPCFYFVELPILVSSVASLYFLELTDMFKPVRSGFSCHDRSLSLPYIEPTHEVVPFLMLLSLAFAAPAITIMIGEGILFCCLSRRKNGGGVEADINAAGCNFNSYIRRAVRFVGVHVFGLCATALITDIIQLMTGYHTPYFLTVCKPNYTTLNMSCDENSYVLEDICSGADPAIINAGRKTFPSQHATLASFAAVYISMYFNSTLTDSSKLLKPLLVFSFIICAIICGLTRIIQYKSHAMDVYLGFLLGGGIAFYLGLHAVGNFQPSEDKCTPQSQPRGILMSLTDLGHHPDHHLPAKSGSSIDGLSSSHSEGLLHRNRQHRAASSLGSLNRAGADVEVLSPRSPMGKETMVTFNTLPRAHTPALEDPARRSASIHHSMDSSRSKQLLSQWKSKNESRKHSLQAVESGGGGMEARCSSEPSAVGLDSELLKMATGGGDAPPSNSMAGGPRVSIQSRPGSSQLVHIPEETQEAAGGGSPRGAAAARANWLKGAEKSATLGRTSREPRIMQVIAMSKQAGLLQSGSQSFEGSVRYRALPEQEAGPAGGIVRVEAHPENDRPTAQGGDGAWTWKSQSSLRHSFELNDLNRDSESSESPRDGYGSADRRRANPSTPVPAAVPAVPSAGGELHHQGISTIRVTPMEGGETLASESHSVASSSRDSTLRRKGNVILIPERGNSPDNTRNIFYKGTSSTPAYKQ